MEIFLLIGILISTNAADVKELTIQDYCTHNNTITKE